MKAFCGTCFEFRDHVAVDRSPERSGLRCSRCGVVRVTLKDAQEFVDGLNRMPAEQRAQLLAGEWDGGKVVDGEVELGVDGEVEWDE